MASTSASNMDPIKIIFIDIPAGVAVDSTFEFNAAFHDFTSLLSRMSGSVFDQIKGLQGHQLSGKGFILRDGCWWYRIVKLAPSEEKEANSNLAQPGKGAWCKLTNLTSYNHMRENELASGLSPKEGWIEVQHDLQKKRDEAHATEARETYKNWRSSIGNFEQNPADDSGPESFQFASTSVSVTNTSDTSLHSPDKVNKKNSASDISYVVSDRDTESDSVGSCTPTAQINHLLNEYQARLYPFVIEWPNPPRCTLTHLNENSVSQDALSRNHKPFPFAAFTKGKEHAEGLPSYTPRPGPFPAQIGSPPSTAYCAYEIHDDIEYNPDSPKLEDARIQVTVASQALASHNARYGSFGPVIDTVPDLEGVLVDRKTLHTSMSLPGMGFDHSHTNSAFHSSTYPVQSAPAHMQSFHPPPWTGNDSFIGIGQAGQRSFSEETYSSTGFGGAPYQDTNYLGASTFNDQMSRNSYGSLSFARSISGPMSTSHSSLMSPPPFTGHAVIHHPSCPPPPQDVVPQPTSFGHSNMQSRGPSPGIFSNGPLEVNTDAMKETEILKMRAQSQQYRTLSDTSQMRSRQPTPSQISRSSSVNRHGVSPHPPSAASSRQSSHTVLPGFSRTGYGTPAPTFATADDFTQCFEMAARGLDPALEVNHRRMVEMHSDREPATHFTGSSMMPCAISGEDVPPGSPADDYRTQLLNFQGLKSHQTRNHRQLRKYQPNTRLYAQQNLLWNPKAGQEAQFYVPRKSRATPISGKFSPPKPRRKGQSAANVIDRYNRGSLVQGPVRGGYLHPSAGSAPQGNRYGFEQGITSGVEMPTRASSEAPSLFNEVSQELTSEYIRCQNSSPGRRFHATIVKGRSHSGRSLGLRTTATPSYRPMVSAQIPAALENVDSNIVLGPQFVVNSGRRFDINANTMQGYTPAYPTYGNGPNSTQQRNPGLRRHSRANSKLSEYLHSMNSSTQLSDYIKPDKSQNHQRAKAKAPSSEASSFSPSPSPALSNFSDDFILNGDGSSKKKKKKKAKAKRNKVKRGVVKDYDNVKTVNEQENAKKDQQLENARATRAKRRSSGKLNDGKEKENDRGGENVTAEETKIEGDVLMNEG